MDMKTFSKQVLTIEENFDLKYAQELKFPAKNHIIKVKGKVSEGLMSSTTLAPSKRQYVNALAKELTNEQIAKEIKNVPKPEPKKRHIKKSSSFLF